MTTDPLKSSYSVADGRALAERLPPADAAIVVWLCERIQELERQLSADAGQVDGVCAICGVKGWYVQRSSESAPELSPERAVGMVGNFVARVLTGQAPLQKRGDVLICSPCARLPM